MTEVKSVRLERKNLKDKEITFRVSLETEKYLQLATRHDYLLYKGKGMAKENLSEWIRFLVNSRLTQIIDGGK